MSQARVLCALVLFAAVACRHQPDDESIALGAIEFFGYKGVDVEAVRAVLPVHEGARIDEPSDALNRRITDAVVKTVGQAPTDISFVCCDDKQRAMLYIGLPGATVRPFAFTARPSGEARLPAAAATAVEDMLSGLADAVQKGQAGEDDSQGFMLTEYPPARAKQLALRQWAVSNDALILRVLTESSDSHQRALAALAAGYGTQSAQQIATLAAASLDPEDEVRNNATRALAVLARAQPSIVGSIPAAPFIALLSSGTWSDRNKATMLLDVMSKPRDPSILTQLQSEAADALTEMAKWRTVGHAYPSRMILGRIAGIDEARLNTLATEGHVDQILERLSLSPDRSLR